MAPSPTGLLHVGVAHTALFNWLFARHNKGTFILRIDDSDPVRSKKEFEKNIIEGLHWLGLDWDEGPDIGGDLGPYRESERRHLYDVYITKLLKKDAAYYCYCTPQELEEERKKQQESSQVPKYSGKCSHLSEEEKQKHLADGHKPAIRFRNRGGLVKFHDMVRGDIEVDMTQFGDFLIARSDGSPLLNFSVIIDDIEMEITHVIRGEDFLNATPYQILIYEALEVKPPEIANLSFVYAPDHTKLSKRHGATAVTEYRDLGYLPEAMLNFLALIGWNPGDEREIFTREELIKEFDFAKVQKGAPIFNIEKLNWYNQHYLQKKSDKELSQLLKPFVPASVSLDLLSKIAPLIKERINKFSDISGLAGFFWEAPSPTKDLFKDQNSAAHLSEAISSLSALSVWKKDDLNSTLQPIPEKNGWKTGDFFMTMRLAVTGSRVTPPLSESIEILGKEETVKRVQEAIKRLSA